MACTPTDKKYGLLMGQSWPDEYPITASSSAGELVPENLLDLQPSRKWRSASTDDQTIEGSFRIMETQAVNRDRPVNMCVLAGNNLTKDNTVCLTLYNAIGDKVFGECVSGEFFEMGWGVQPLGLFGLGGVWEDGSVIGADATQEQNISIEDIAVDPRLIGGLYTRYIDTDYIAFFFERVWASRFEITVSDSGNPDGYMEIGRLKLGNAVEVFMAPGYEMGWRDTSSLTRTRSGALRSDNGRSYRYANVNTILRHTQTNLSQIFRHTGLRSDVVWSAFPPAVTNEGRENLILGRLTSYGASHWTNEGVTTNFTIEEAI